MLVADWIALAGVVVNAAVLGCAAWTGWAALRTVNLQREELVLQRKELALTREELKAQRLALEEQAKSQAKGVEVARLQLLVGARSLQVGTFTASLVPAPFSGGDHEVSDGLTLPKFCDAVDVLVHEVVRTSATPEAKTDPATVGEAEGIAPLK